MLAACEWPQTPRTWQGRNAPGNGPWRSSCRPSAGSPSSRPARIRAAACCFLQFKNLHPPERTERPPSAPAGHGCPHSAHPSGRCPPDSLPRCPRCRSAPASCRLAASKSTGCPQGELPPHGSTGAAAAWAAKAQECAPKTTSAAIAARRAVVLRITPGLLLLSCPLAHLRCTLLVVLVVEMLNFRSRFAAKRPH